MKLGVVHTAIAVAIGGLSGLAVGLLLLSERFLVIAEVLLLAVALAASVRVLPSDHRRTVATLVALKYSMQVALSVLLYTWAAAAGHADWVLGDDGSYFNAAWTFARYVRGEVQPGVVVGLVDLQGSYVYLATALYYLLGPDTLLMPTINAALSSALVVIVYDFVRRIFQQRAALTASVLVAFYPSLVLWSALNLKETVAFTLTALVLWLALLFQLRPRWWVLALLSFALVPLETVRRFLFVGLALLAVMAVSVTPGLAWASRVRWTSVAAVGAALLLALDVVGQGKSFLPTLTSLEGRRFSTTAGARTSFLDTVVCRPGQTFVVAPTDGQGGGGPAVVYASPGSRIVVARGGAEAPVEPRPNAIVVYPGDLIVCLSATSDAPAAPQRIPVPTSPALAPGGGAPAGGPQPPSFLPPPGLPAPAPQSERILLEVPPTQTSVTILSSETDPVARTIAHAPRGLQYVLFAPFPWEARRLIDIVTVPEMLIWYVVLASAAWNVWAARSRWWAYAPAALFVVGTVGVMTLAEGNVGSIFRHRGMIVPLTVALASPSLARLASVVWTAVASRYAARAP